MNRSLPAFAESAVRAYKIAMTPPMEPVLLVVDHDLQLRPMGAVPKIPRLVMPSPPAGETGAVREAARLLVAAENPRINAGRMARTPNGIALLVELAELLQAAVNGGGDRVNFPSRHPLAGAGSGEADVILNLEVQGGGVRAPRREGARRTRRRSTSRRSGSTSRATCRTSSTWPTPTSTSPPTRKPRSRCSSTK
jgi:Thiamine pyrophosphate-requiring enzymes [acetolactate synthase, pyruvate dehydrogenase (cytochrome), glyoxylate carboligase, phosphonopyruvate decarboxylase]